MTKQRQITNIYACHSPERGISFIQAVYGIVDSTGIIRDKLRGEVHGLEPIKSLFNETLTCQDEQQMTFTNISFVDVNLRYMVTERDKNALRT